MRNPLRVLLITSWNTHCGIAEHSRLLVDAVTRADPEIEVSASAEWLDPQPVFAILPDTTAKIVHLNHHDALHSRWTADHIQQLRDRGIEVVITYHDTRESLPPDHKIWSLQRVASSLIVHEPVEDLPAIYWRQGVPAAAQHPAYYGARSHWNGDAQIRSPYFKAYPQQPVLGTVGFNFPWKNFDRLAEETAAAGWAFVLVCPNATQEDRDRWTRLNNSTLVLGGLSQGWIPQDRVVNALAGCDVTAFMYECANTGTSGAIRQGIAARKPVIALATCRQFRDLVIEHRVRGTGIQWVHGWDGFHAALRGLEPMAWHPMVSYRAHEDSWAHLGQRYASLYRSLVGQVNAGEVTHA